MSSFILFITLALTLAVVLTLIVLLPWLRRLTITDNQLMQVNIDVFKDRLIELAADYKIGSLSEEQYISQKTELERQLLQTADDNKRTIKTTKVASTAGTKTNQVTQATYVSKKSQLILLVWIPLLMSVGYALAEDRSETYKLWQAQDNVGKVADDLLTGKIDIPPEWATKDSLALILAMQTNVYRHAHDADRWMRLAELFMSLQANDQAIEAMARAYRLSPEDNMIATEYAQARFFINNGNLDSISRKALQKVLAENPDHQGAQMLMAMGETRASNFEAAQEWVNKLKSGIVAKDGDHSEALASLDKLTQTIQDQQQASLKALTVTVSLNPSLLPLIKESDTLFVAVRDINGGAPYAVKRLAAKQLLERKGAKATTGIDVRLSDNDAMMPTRNLSVAKGEDITLVVTARISPSGQAMTQTGDLTANPVPLKGNMNQVNINIAQQAP